MLSRKYSLKTRYNFNKVLKRGETFHTARLLIKFLKVSDKIFEKELTDKKFAVIASNKFSKKAVVQNKARRIILSAIKEKLEKFPKHYYYVFIPKKSLLNKDGKIDISPENLGPEIDTFLSEVHFA